MLKTFFLNRSGISTARFPQRRQPSGLYAAMLAVALMLGNFDGVAAAVNPPVANESADATVLMARTAFDAREYPKLKTAFAAMPRQHPLYPYVNYWFLMGALAQSGTFAIAGKADIELFLSQNADIPLADSLRREWLKILGAQDQWVLFNQHAPLLIADDIAIACHGWRYRFEQGDRTAIAELRALWRNGKPLPSHCHDLVLKTRSVQPLMDDEIWRRIRRLLERGEWVDAAKTAQGLHAPPASLGADVKAISANPLKLLSKLKPDTRHQWATEKFLLALGRSARSDSDAAAEALGKHQALLSPSDRAYAWALIGQQAAMNHHPQALSWFERAHLHPLDEEQMAWKTRAALRAGDWRIAHETIEAMPPQLRREPVWRYWLARALDNEKNPEAATIALSLRTALSQEHSFYAILAAEELGLHRELAWQGFKPLALDIENMIKRPAMQRILALYKLGLRMEGLREWQVATRDFSDRELLTAAEVARINNIPDRAISAADRTITLHDFSQRFPTPYRDDLQANSRQQQLDEAWVFGLIRQESRFMAEIKSRVGAMGLMQIMPATARWVAGKMGLKDVTPRNAYETGTNLALGTWYLRHMLDHLGHAVLATAGYNAGPGRAKRWQADKPLEGAIYIETIPFNETRDYVQKVMTNQWYYRNQLGQPAISLKSLLGTVPGKLADGSSNSDDVALSAAPQPDQSPPAATAERP